MNAKKMKELRRKVKPIQVEWLQSLLPEEQARLENTNEFLAKPRLFLKTTP